MGSFDFHRAADTSRGFRKIRFLIKRRLEAVIWLLALMLFAVTNPDAGLGITICPIKLLGFSFCPGCGLGKSIAYLLHGDIHRSMDAHLLGIPAVMILVYRAFTIIFPRDKQFDPSFTLTERNNHA